MKRQQFSDSTRSDEQLVASEPTSTTTELSLSFEGQVYVFNGVPPQKVHAVLLLLGGQEIPTTLPTADPSFQNNRGVDEAPQPSKHSQRMVSLARFREKRKERCFDRKVRYHCHKEVAQRMHRKNGQFVSSRKSNKDWLVGTSSWDSSESCFQNNSTPSPEIVECKCEHCGISESSTPIMCQGPAGPRSLCNACGLIWGNKEITGETQAVSVGIENPTMKNEKEASSEAEASVMWTEILTEQETVESENFPIIQDQASPEDMMSSSPEIGIYSSGSYEQTTCEDLNRHVPEGHDNPVACFDEQCARESGLTPQCLWGDLRALSSTDFWDLQATLNSNGLQHVSTVDYGNPSSLIEQIDNENYLGSIVSEYSNAKER